MEALNAQFDTIASVIGSLVPADVRYDCENCDDTGWALDAETHRPNGRRCECATERRAARLRTWQAAEVDRLNDVISGRVDLSKTQPRPYMADIGNKSVWLHGTAGRGKTHCAAWMIKQAITSAQAPFDWGWYPIRKLISAWKDQHSELVELKIEALTTIRQVTRCELLVIDDIDKIGTITAAREEELYGLIDELHGKKPQPQLIVTSQHDIDGFCDRMSREALFIRSQGKGPVQRRLHEICREVKV